MSGEILVEKPVTVPLYQKASIWNETESMPPRTEVDFSPLFSVAPDKCVCVCVCVWEGGGHGVPAQSLNNLSVNCNLINTR